MVDKVLPSPILPQVSPRTLEGVIATSSTTTRQLLDVIREHARAINQMADYLNALDAGWLTYAPTIGALSGTITTVGATVGRYKMLGANTAMVYLDITITTNGTGATAVSFTLPVEPARYSVGIGREASAGTSLNFMAVPAGVHHITTYAGAYPGASGFRLIGSVVYPLTA